MKYAPDTRDGEGILYDSAIFGDGEAVVGGVASAPTIDAFQFVDDTNFLFVDDTLFEFITP